MIKSKLYLLLFSLLTISIMSCQSDNAKSESTEAPKEVVPKNPTQLLEGRWENIASDKEFIIFTNEKIIRRHEGANKGKDLLTTIFYDFYEKCHAPCQTQSIDVDVSQFQCFTVKEDGIYKCYKILKLDAKDFEYTLTDGTGPKYAYKRLQ